MIHDTHAERLSEEQWQALTKAGFQHTREVVFVALDVAELPRSHGCEGKMHRALKRAAADMLAQRGETEVRLEHFGFDVYGATLGIVVECGTMSLTKVYEALVDEKASVVREVWNLGFPKLENYCILTKFQLNLTHCSFIDVCKPKEWSKHDMRNCKLGGTNCYVKRQYLIQGCLHLNGYETLKNDDTAKWASSAWEMINKKELGILFSLCAAVTKPGQR